MMLAIPMAHADDREQSRAAFRRGVELFQRGQMTEARDAFEQAYKLFPHPSILLNLGLARARTGEYLQAEQDLVRFLADDGGATSAEIQNARTALAEARTHIGTLTVHVSPPQTHATLDGHPLPLANGAIENERVQVGDHTLELTADGHKSETVKVRIAASRGAIVETELAAIAEKPKTTTRNDTPRVVAGVSLLSAGGVALAIAVGCGVRAITLANGYNDRNSDDFQKPSVKNSGIAFRTASDVSLVSGIVLAAVGVGFLLWPTPKTQVSVGPASIVIGGRF